MTGHHEVRRWEAPARHQTMTLPEGWKPFAVLENKIGGFDVVCRKWVRDEKTKEKKEPST
jgi:hypothetical protein